MEDGREHRVLWAGVGLILGAGIGIGIGLLFGGGVGIALGTALGAGIGVVIGAIVDVDGTRSERVAGRRPHKP